MEGGGGASSGWSEERRITVPQDRETTEQRARLLTVIRFPTRSKEVQNKDCEESYHAHKPSPPPLPPRWLTTPCSCQYVHLFVDSSPESSP